MMSNGLHQSLLRDYWKSCSDIRKDLIWMHQARSELLAEQKRVRCLLKIPKSFTSFKLKKQLMLSSQEIFWPCRINYLTERNLRRFYKSTKHVTVNGEHFKNESKMVYTKCLWFMPMYHKLCGIIKFHRFSTVRCRIKIMFLYTKDRRAFEGYENISR